VRRQKINKCSFAIFAFTVMSSCMWWFIEKRGGNHRFVMVGRHRCRRWLRRRVMDEGDRETNTNTDNALSFFHLMFLIFNELIIVINF
jgi:hypothetical protein